MTNTVNPFYGARAIRRTQPFASDAPQVRWAKLPRAPITGSPVPRLTSLYHWSEPGAYGNRSYPGNCGGQLIKDLIGFYSAKSVYDPLTGSGTCRDVCQELRLRHVSTDLHMGIDACDPKSLPFEKFSLAWLHPPYWRQKIYGADERCLSLAPTLDAFLDRYAALIRTTAQTLEPRGKLAILMGDYTDREAGFVPLTYFTKKLAFEAGLRQCATDIIRFSHGASSSRKTYRSAFIPGLHDVLAVFEAAPNARRSA